MNLDRIRTAIEEAVSDCVNSIQLPGIVDGAVRSVATTSQHLQRGGIAFLLDVMVARGDLIRSWSEEQGEFAYLNSDIPQVSRLTV